MRNSIVHGLLSVLLLAASDRVCAQNIPYENVTIADGLSQGMIFHAMQSRDGFLWFGTKDGLNRYDGYNFKVYTNDPFDPFSISGNSILLTAEDCYENLWIVIENGGLNYFERKTGKFYHLPVGPGGLPAITHACAVGMPDGSLWLGTVHGLCHLQWKPGRTGPIPGNPDLRDALTVETVFLDKSTVIFTENQDVYSHGLLARDGTLWICTYNSPYALAPGSKKFRMMLPPVKHKDNYRFSGIFEDADGGIQTLFDYSGSSKLPERFVYKGGSWKQIPHYDINNRFEQGSGALRDSMLQAAIRNRDVLQVYYLLDCRKPGHTHRPPVFDRSGNIWVGTNGYGLHKYKPASSLFRHFLKGHSISGIFNSSRLILNSVDLKLVGLDRTTGRELGISPELANYGFGHYLETREGDGWSIDRSGALVRFRPGEKPREYPFGLSFLYLLAADRSGNIWASKAAGSTLLCFDPSTGKPAWYDLSGMLGDFTSFYALLHDNRGHIWITNSKGLAEGVPDGKGGYTFRMWRNNPADPHSLGYNATLSLCEDPHFPNDYIWVGTKGGGLNCLDRKNERFFQLNTRNSDLPNDVIYGILPDDEGNLWVSTNRGLSRITLPRDHSRYTNPKAFYFQNYRASDGLQHDEFNTGAYFRCADGQLLFGGVNGLTAFYPNQLPKRNNDASVHITDLKINNKPYYYQEDNGKIEFSYDQNILTIGFALLDFANPIENRFRYRLHGADPDWVESGPRHFANYTRLSPGSYKFEVEGSTGGGVWSPKSATLNFVIYPPWYATWWAYTLYAVLLCGSGYLFYSIQLKRKLESAENERLKEMDAVKTRLYTNITHEFRTPLTVILGLAAEIGKEGNARIQDMARMVERNGQGLLRLINQILDLAKLESGAMGLHLVRTDVVAFCRYLSESFHSFAEAKQIQLHFLTEVPGFEMDFDREKLQNILHNLLGNAMKFTPEGGHVYMQIAHADLWRPLAPQGWHEVVKPAKDINREWILLRVSDTGPGIPESDFSKIFDRFAQSDESAVVGGTGIGLALVRELVQLMQGGLALRNMPGKGAEFMVALPVMREADPAGPLPPDPPLIEPEMPEQEMLTATATADDVNLPTVLLVEDNADVAGYIQSCLAGTYHVIYARNGQEGIDLALEKTPDLIISDVMMPLKNGYELTDTLKNDVRSSHIPIVLLTAKASMDDRIAGLRRGADAYLTKPFHREELQATLDQLLENRRRIQAYFGQRIFADASLPPEAAPPDVDIEDAFLQKLRGIVEDNITDPGLEMPQLERALAMSRSQIFRKVKALTGKSPSLFIRSVRLMKARELLRSTTLTVSEIAYDTGFSSPQYFSDAFFEEFGIRPSATRN